MKSPSSASMLRRHLTPRCTSIFCFIAAAALSASTASSQVFGDLNQRGRGGPARSFAGGSLLVAFPQGEFKEYVDVGFGVGGHFIYALDRSRVLALRIDAGYLIYDNESSRACFSTTVGCRVQVDVNTSNNIVVAGIGPQIMAPNGTFRPYVAGSVGLGYFFTESSIEGSSDFEPFARTNNFDDATLAYTATAGLYIPVRKGGGRRPISIDLGATYHWNGEASYLRRGSIQDNPSGPPTITPIRSNTDLLVIKLGVSAGF